MIWGLLVVLPEARRDGTLAVVVLIQTLLKEFLSENTSLREAVHPFFNFDVDTSVEDGLAGKVVHLCKLFGEVIDFHVHVLRTCHRCHEVKTLEINGAVACTLGGDDTF